MERLLLVRCPELEAEDPDGRALRALVELTESVGRYCPWVTAVRPGVLTLPARGPARFFGGEDAITALIRDAATACGRQSHVGVADGLFAAQLAASVDAIVPTTETVGFLAPWSIEVLGRPELTQFLARLGLRTLGGFAALPERHVYERLGADAVACHQVARGRRGELEGLRDRGLAQRLTALARTLGPTERQGGFWGGRQRADDQAAEALAAVQGLLGPEGVVVARPQGGRDPGARVRLGPWSAAAPPTTLLDERPWPGRLPSPPPAVLHDPPLTAQLTDERDEPVTVRGDALGAAPTALAIDRGPWRSLVGWAGPWPKWERWWTPTARRVAHLQVVTEDGLAHLLCAQKGAWWVVATYD